MLRRTVHVILVAVAALAPAAQAQIGRQPPRPARDPDYWVGLSIGYVDGITLSDDATGAVWRFGYTSQLRGTFEKTIARGTTFGVAAGFATAPLIYEPGSFSDSCAGGCSADADVAQYTAFVRGGGGEGFHVVYTLEGGVTQFSKFRERGTDMRLAPANGSYDATLGFGAGLSYGFSRTMDIYIGQMLDFVFHRQSSSTINQAAPRLYTFRGGFRLGF